MAGFKMKIRKFSATTGGKVVMALLYAIMLALVIIFFTGNGEFIYEAF